MKNFLFTIFSILILTSCANEPYEASATEKKNIIKKSDPLFNDLLRIIDSGTDPISDEVCVEFIYPFTLLIYNQNFQVINTVTLTSDNMFKTLLTNLANNQSISLSYPLTTELPDGTIFSVNNNEELRIALDFCTLEDIITHCNGNFCHSNNNNDYFCWQIPFIEGEDNTFAGATFTPNINGTISIHHLATNNSDYVGTWQFISVGGVIYFNIHIVGNSDIATSWNKNYEIITFDQDKMVLQSNNGEKNLVKFIGAQQIYTIGSIGPKNGIVAYDKGGYTNGWRYIEVINENIVPKEWGCMNSTVNNAQFDNLGSGLQNSYAILNIHNNLNNYYNNPAICSTLNDGTVAAKIINYNFNNATNWFIPSFDELNLIYNNISVPQHLIFEDSYYWSSTELNITNAKVINLQTGQTNSIDKNSSNIKTIVARYF